MKKRQRGVFFKKMLMFFNHLVSISLLLSYFAPHISPEKIWLLAFFGLTYPLLFILNVAMIIVWLFIYPKRLLYPLIVVLCGWSHFDAFVQWRTQKNDMAHDGAVKVMSYNVRLFDLYNWNNNKHSRNGFFKLIQQEAPDIMCLQDFYTSEAPAPHGLNNLDTLLKLQKAKFAYTAYSTTLRNTDHWGSAIFSIYPIIRSEHIKFTNSNNLALYCDIKMNADTVRVYNLHLQSIHFNKVDYKFMDDLMHNKETDKVKYSVNILKRLKTAYIKRAWQADTIAKHIASSPYPVIVCGDFNDTPSSYAYNTISENLEDAFVESGSGFGRTYVGKFPSFRIDYILHSDDYESQNFYIIEKQLSDHYALCTYLRKK